MLELIQGAFAFSLLIILGWLVWESSIVIDEKKQRQKAGITDYYDNPIKKRDDQLS